MSLKTIILSAGKGTRMKSNQPKVLHKVCGISMINRVIKICSKIGTDENILVLGHKKDEILKEVSDISFVVQENLVGTGDAVMQVIKNFPSYNGTYMVVCGDTPLLKVETLKELYNSHKKNKVDATILTSINKNPFGYGRIVREADKVTAIIEENDATKEIKEIKEINTGVYCFEAKALTDALLKIDNNNKKGEYYLTDVIKKINENDGTVSTFLLQNYNEVLGVNSRIDLEKANKILQKRINLKHMENGVTIINSENTYIDENVQIGQDTIIYPGVSLQGNTIIGENCQISGDTTIINSKLNDNIIVKSSVITDSLVETDVTIGPFAHIRPNSHLKEKVHIGNFVEIKKSVLESGVKAGHLTYLGDAIVGEKTNIGAGTITCNYDGKNKYKTIIGKNVFIGSDTMLVAPVNIGDEATVGAGSVITKEVPEKSLALSRCKQVIKFEWRK